MKVIGIVPGTYTTQAAKLLVEMTPEELSHIQGEWKTGKEPKVGMKVEVDKIFRRLRELKDNQYKLEQARKQLRAVADLLEPLDSVVSCNPPEEENGDAEQSSQS